MFRGEQFLLQLQCSDDDLTSVKKIMHEYCSSFELINIKSLSGGASKEFSYYVNLKRNKEYLDFFRELKSIGAVQYLNLFRDEEHI